jgi:hypothetical protein
MEFTRINNDVNGNPRYVTHFLNIPLDADVSVSERYALACKKANKIGGKKYHTKAFGGGIVFQSYNLDILTKDIQEL